MARLAATPRWQALLHINPGATLRGVGTSYVDDADFFLSANGARDPLAELRATRKALAPPHSPARCRFPARYRFLAEHLGWHEADPLGHCQAYHDWRERMPIGQLVLVFPAAYLNSPSSMFGHTLLRLDASKTPESEYLSRAITFSAQTAGQDNSALYIWRGLAGGYPGRFSVSSYAQRIHQYGFLENRDIWEYTLNLNHDELDWLVAHLWELRDINFDYYFFDENCSFRLLELVNVARPEADLLQGLRVTELPVHTIRTLEQAGLVTSRHYRASKVNALTHAAEALSPADRRLAARLMHDPSLLESNAFKARPPGQRHRIADVAYQALRIKGRKSARSRDTAQASLALLRAVQQNPAPPDTAAAAPAPPEAGHRTHLASLAAGSLDGRAFGEFGFRMTYHDVLDRPQGYLDGAGIEGFNLKLRAYEDGDVELERLDLVHIRSIAPRSTFFSPISWFVDGGLEQVPLEHDRGLGLQIQGGPGLAWQLGHLRPYGFAVARAETVPQSEPTLAAGAGAQLGALWIQKPVQLGIDFEQLYFTPGFERQRTSLTANVPISTNNALRSSCRYESQDSGGITQCQIGFRHFF
ncbi:DUF4105 domain-containing protein [uncultured Salinisphaera sp.]|uniref:Lnb N-terminal periplasmic domain-containing protein n=1 Tax=uncultured Salinisphaera sp. TaxID=359372 RepID=UPI0032B237EA|tara:strand:- start:1984 stop:3741 length:1758 start_codon:yes stop_codon:yes gene_type:complete